ncbi:tetracycline regulation of excision, RteC [Flavobacterium sp. RSP49]|uniref:RteC domain-containing protein n=1 Tax=Flavobacterium sp. RSP49 TaxID=2497487 RepID=UPI000F839D8D|nr:RteC domain-containing protein [Flavobacterium sp. RSP49]RTZ01330.1 tetracycline regulation of excision, RteC [Flavobacterium sp. RSP49]
MKLFAESLMLELEHQLKLIHLETENQVQLAEQAIKNSIAALEKLKTFFLKYKQLNKKEEIEFFRDIKPKFAAKLIYYNEIYTIETNKPFGSQKTMDKYYKAELNKLKVFFVENQEFYRYYRTANNFLDNKYFIRAKYDLKLMVDSFYFQADHRFNTSHDYKVACILANDDIKVFLEEQIAKLKRKTITIQSPSPLSKGPKWTGSKVELIELIYALHTEGVFNNGSSGLKEVTTFFESAFNIHLGQFNRVFLEIRNRKSERTKFLNTLKNKLMIRMDEADEN